jgi:hypothetical protein
LSLGGVSTSYKAATPEIQIINKIKTKVDFCPLAEDVLTPPRDKQLAVVFIYFIYYLYFRSSGFKGRTNAVSLGGVNTSYKATRPEIQIINKINKNSS